MVGLPHGRVDDCFDIGFIAVIELENGCGDPALHVRLMIEFADQAFGEIGEVNPDVGLDRDIDLGPLPVEPREA